MDKLTLKLPDLPGVYFFKKGKTVLYIGKATSLRDRVKSYFGAQVIETRGQAIVNMVNLATGVDFETTDSVLEALILESSLIKKYQPKYNTREKDDKSYFYTVITKEEYPRVLVVRGKDIFDNSYQGRPLMKIFGPFPYGMELKEAMNIVRKIFPFADKCSSNSNKDCFESQIGLCPGICSGKISREEYLNNIKNIKLFFEGKKSRILKDLEKKMKEYAEKLQFEKAEELKKRIFALKHINDIALIKRKNESLSFEEVFRIEAYDVSHLSNKNRVGVMTVVENGEIKKSDYRKFKIKGVGASGDTNDLKEVLDRRFYHEEWRLPDIIVVDGGIAQKNVAEKITRSLALNIPIVAVTKNEYHKPSKILGDRELIKKHEEKILLANNESHRFAVSFQKSLRKI